MASPGLIVFIRGAGVLWVRSSLMEFGGPIERIGLVCVYITRSLEPVRTVSIRVFFGKFVRQHICSPQIGSRLVAHKKLCLLLFAQTSLALMAAIDL